MISVMPQLIMRLHALRGLHTEAAVFAESLRMISEEQERVQDDSRVIVECIERMENGLRENATIAERNVRSLETRVAELLAKV